MQSGTAEVVMDAVKWAKWQANWDAGFVEDWRNPDRREPWDVVIRPPVSAVCLGAMQERGGLRLPDDFVHVLTHYAGAVTCYRRNMEHRQLGDVRTLWDAAALPNFWGEYREILETFPLDVESEDDGYWEGYNRAWHDKVPFLGVGNGDQLAFGDRDETGRCPVYYLSHDGGELHGCRLGLDFVDFMDRWTSLGCPGPEGGT